MKVREVTRSAVFGGVDGLGLAIGVVLVLHGKAVAILVAAGAANAAAELAGMAAGQWLSSRDETLRVPRALANGLGAFAGALLPVIALALGGPYAALGVLLALAVLIAHAMPSDPAWRSWAETGATLAIVAGVVAITSLVV